MNDKTCGTCRYWHDPENDFSLGLADTRPCNRAIQLWDATYWFDEDVDGVAVYERRLHPKFADRRMFVQDGSDYRATLRTRSDFGCVEWDGAPE